METFGQSKQGPVTPLWLLSGVWCSLFMSWLTKQTFSGYEAAQEGHGKATSLQLDEARDVTELAGPSPALFVPHHFSPFTHLHSPPSQDPVSVQGGPKCLQMALPPVVMEMQPNQCSLSGRPGWGFEEIQREDSETAAEADLFERWGGRMEDA